MSGYRYTLSEDALGVVVELRGPGMPQHANRVHVQQHLNDWASKYTAEDWESVMHSNAERLVHLLNAAFEAGKAARSKEFRQLLGMIPR